MKKLLLVLTLLLVFVLSACGGNEQVDSKLRITQHPSGEVTVCLFEIYEDGSQTSKCDLFILDTTDLEERIQALEDKLAE